LNAEGGACNDVAVGAGVGVPLGILLAMSLIWAFWERRKVGIVRGREVDYAAWRDEGANAKGGHPMVISEAYGDTGAQELRGDVETRKSRGDTIGELA